MNPRHPKKSKPAPAAPPPLTRGKLWAFRLTALLLPVLFLCLLEVGLRLGGYGYDPHFFRKIEKGGREFFINNETFSYRFFPEQLARWPDPFVFPSVKEPGTVRIFILGESAAMGDPQPAYGASRYMDVLLRERFPGKKFEVINLGITAINSHVILPIARECAAHEGDFWIIYMGNNEMVGPFGAATVFGAKALPRSVTRINLAVQKTRTGQLLMAGLRRLSQSSKNTSWGGMEMFLENKVPPGDPRKETVYKNFEGNLREIVAAGTGAGAKVVLNTVSVNLRDCPPFASQIASNVPPAELQQFRDLLAEAKTLQAQTNFSEARERLLRANALQPGFAEGHFRLAQSEPKPEAAAREFQAACDLDALPFRADTRINGAIKALAVKPEENLVLCDAEKILAADGASGVAGDESFFEHVHFNFDGNYRLGKLWAEAIARQLPVSEKNAATNWLAQVDCERALGLTIWNRHFVLQAVMRRMQAPPLSTRFNNEAQRGRIVEMDTALRAQHAAPGAVGRAREEFAEAVRRAPDDAYLYEGLANFFEAVNDPTNAATAYRNLWEKRPADFYACLQLGRLLGELGRPDAGEPYLREASQLRPSLPESWFELGQIQSEKGDFAAALSNFERAAKIRPRDASYVCAMAQMQGRLNRHAEALQTYRRAIELNPNSWETHFQFAGELVANNQPTQAMEEFGNVLKINPRHVTSHINLGVLFVRFNRMQEAIACFQTALKLDPENRTARDYLSSVMEREAHQRPVR